MVTSEDYELIEDSASADSFTIQLKTGKYAGVKYRNGKVNLQPPADKTWEDLEAGVDCYPVIEYTYELDESTVSLDNMLADTEFENYIGDVLAHFLQDAFDNEKYAIGGNDGESGNDNPAESDQ